MNGTGGAAGDPSATGDVAMAQSTKGKMMAKSADELKKARESRAADALKMKDEQLRILSEQNASLLQSLDKVEDEGLQALED